MGQLQQLLTLGPMQKNYSKKISVGDINTFIGAMSGFPDSKFGIFITSLRDGYSTTAIDRVRTVDFDLLLTNIYNMEQDIPPTFSIVVNF